MAWLDWGGMATSHPSSAGAISRNPENKTESEFVIHTQGNTRRVPLERLGGVFSSAGPGRNGDITVIVGRSDQWLLRIQSSLQMYQYQVRRTKRVSLEAIGGVFSFAGTGREGELPPLTTARTSKKSHLFSVGAIIGIAQKQEKTCRYAST